MFKPRVEIILVVVMLCAWWWWSASSKSMIYKRSYVTGKEYFVKNMKNSDKVADRLAELESHLRRFLSEASTTFPGDPLIKNIRSRWNGTLAETSENSRDIAFSVGKDAIFVCLRKEDGVTIEDFNTSVFVLIHEISHVATNSYGHKPEFWSNMRVLLEMAEATGYYKYQDYGGEEVISYCNRKLGSNPLTCVKNGLCRSALAGKPVPM